MGCGLAPDAGVVGGFEEGVRLCMTLFFSMSGVGELLGILFAWFFVRRVLVPIIQGVGVSLGVFLFCGWAV